MREYGQRRKKKKKKKNRVVDEGTLVKRQEMSWFVSDPRPEMGAKSTAAFPLCPHLSLSLYDPFPAASCSLA